jgi:hypothetical protein
MQTTEWPERFAVLVFAGLQILIPQNEIYSLEPIIDMTPPVADSHSVGQLQQSGHAWSLYALSANLTLLSSRPDIYRCAILIKNSQPAWGLLCEQVYTVERSQISIHPVPPVMHGKNSPLLALALVGEEVHYISSANLLRRLFTD